MKNFSSLKISVLLAITFFCQFTHAINIGFNQAWFQTHYAGQYLDGYYNETEVNRIFKLTHEAGAKTLRLWFFESSNFPMLEWKGNQILGLKADYIKNVLQTLRIARTYHVYVYMTFLDAQSYRPDKLDKETLAKLRAIYQERGGAQFLEKVIKPLFKAIEDEGLTSQISRIDLSNEMDAVINRFGFDGGWKGAARMLCQWRSFIHGFHSFQNTPVTFSMRLHPLVVHPIDILSDQGPMACADYFDFHSYHDGGEIYRCQSLKRYARENKKPLILGEFGQAYFNHRYDNRLQAKNTLQYIKSAEECGFQEALSWRLSDIRPGHNKEARYSYEAYGQMRPAYWIIQKNNLR